MDIDDLEPRLRDPVVLVQQDGDLAVTLDAGQGLDDDAFGFGHCFSSGSLALPGTPATGGRALPKSINRI